MLDSRLILIFNMTGEPRLYKIVTHGKTGTVFLPIIPIRFFWAKDIDLLRFMTKGFANSPCLLINRGRSAH